MPIPNQHLECSDQITSENTRLIIYGVPRSASTYVWQVMGDIFRAGVIRTHHCLSVPESIPVVRTIRDWRDALVSYWRCHHRTSKEMAEEVIRQYVARFQEHIFTLDYWTEHAPDSPLVRYEDIVSKPEPLFEIAKQLGGPETEPGRRKQILDAHSAAVNRALSNNQQALDKRTLLQPRHVHEASLGLWRRFVSDSGAKLLTALLSPALTKWGYPIETE